MDRKSLSHIVWKCQYHIDLISKYKKSSYMVNHASMCEKESKNMVQV